MDDELKAYVGTALLLGGAVALQMLAAKCLEQAAEIERQRAQLEGVKQALMTPPPYRVYTIRHENVQALGVEPGPGSIKVHSLFTVN